MDYYSFNPNNADSIELLYGSPLRRARVDSNSRCYPPYVSPFNNVFVRDGPPPPPLLHALQPSSTSLVLKKTRERELREQYSDFSNNNQYSTLLNSERLNQQSGTKTKTRPVIKVTVIPNSAVPLKKRRPGVKRVQSSVSNQEIKAKNVYLVVTGKTREKVYEIKTTGSAELAHNASQHRYVRHDEIIEHNLTQLLSSLNMDKKKKGKRKKEDEKVEESDNNSDCNCDVAPRKSRVRITGKIGLTEDDRYVLKCAATVDGKPIETNCYQESYENYPMPSVPWDELQIKHSPMKRMNASAGPTYYTNPSINNQKEVSIQVNLGQEERLSPQRPCYYSQVMSVPIPCPNRSIETQCNPSNFNTVCFSNIDQLRIVSNNKDQLVQCDCTPAKTFPSPKVAECDQQMIPMKSCHSPLVIISVYPKQDQQGDDDDGETEFPKHKGKPRKNGKRTSKVESPTETRDKSPLKSRSPSPSRGKKMKGEAKGDAKSKTAKSKGNTESVSGQITTTTKSSRKERVTQETRVTSGGRKSAKGSSNRTIRTKEVDVQANLPIEGTSSSALVKGRVGAKAGQPETQQLPDLAIERRMMNWVSAKEDASDVTINIAGEHELYDVMLRQAGRTTDLRVRRTLKEQAALNVQNTLDEDSLENFLLHDGTRKRSFSQTFIVNDPPKLDTSLALDTAMPTGINVRDSIEVSHRREEKVNSSESLPPPDATHSFNVTMNDQFLAPVKHYKGDCCDLSNPVERDKQIRELLGVKNRPSSSRNANIPISIEHTEQCLFQAKQFTTTSAIYERISRIVAPATVECACSDHEHDSCSEDEIAQFSISEDDHSEHSLHCDKDEMSCENIMLGSKVSGYNPCDCSPLSTSESNSKTCLDHQRSKERPCQQQHPHIKQHHFHHTKQQQCPHTKQRQHPHTNQPHCPHIKQKQHPHAKQQQCPHTKQQQHPLAKQQHSSLTKLQHHKSALCQCGCGINHMKQSSDCHGLEHGQQLKHDQKISCPNIGTSPLYQQMILNRNVNIYLQIEQFTKQKPIILSRKQYDKVKRTIESSGLTRKLNCICKKTSTYAVSDTRRKMQKGCHKKEQLCPKPKMKCKHTETDHKILTCDLPSFHSRDQFHASKPPNISGHTEKYCFTHAYKIETTPMNDQNEGENNAAGTSCNILTSEPDFIYELYTKGKQGHADEKQKNDSKKQKSSHKQKCTKKTTTTMTDFEVCNTSIGGTDDGKKKNKDAKKQQSKDKQQAKDCNKQSKKKKNADRKNDFSCYCNYCGRRDPRTSYSNPNFTVCFYCGRNKESNCALKVPHDTRNVASTTEVHFTTVRLTKRVTFSATDLLEKREQKPSVANILLQNYQTDSLHTIFKGHRKSPTPNLGTSAYSLMTEFSEYSTKMKEPQPRKPFLKRLMSCLVMRSKTSGVKFGKPIPKMQSMDPSIDSYHISTSLGEIELSSSIYDTSASFYSSHSVRPISSKIKKSFLSSVRGLLISRRY